MVTVQPRGQKLLLLMMLFDVGLCYTTYKAWRTTYAELLLHEQRARDWPLASCVMRRLSLSCGFKVGSASCDYK